MRSGGMRCEESDEQPFDGVGIVIDFVIAVSADLARVFEPVQRRFAGQRIPRLVEHGTTAFPNAPS